MIFINRPFISNSLTRLLSICLISFITLAGCKNFNHKQDDLPNPTAEITLPSVDPEPAQPELTPMAPGQNADGSYSNIWDRIRNGYGLPTIEPGNQPITNQIRWYSNNQRHVNRVTTQCEPYLHYVVSELEANGLPLELALLPIIESSYDPSVTSPSNAAGIWQFIPQTGKNFGLKKNNWYDGRRDVIASTDAAIRYLKKLHAMFNNDWLLAIAAYNAGEGSVARAIQKNKREGKPTDFWSLPLSKQAQSYVPHLLALSKVIANPDQYDLSINNISDTPYFVKINVASQINLAQAAKLANIDAGELKKLNSGFTSWLTHPTDSCEIIVPIADANAFTLQLESLPKLAIKQWQEHMVKKGETLNSIAKRYNVSTDTIATINSVKKSTLRVGQRLHIPLSAPITDPAIIEADELLALRKLQKESGKTSYYTVKSGDNLWNIAKAHDISRNTLAQLNNLSEASKLKPGQKLLVLSPGTMEKKPTETAAAEATTEKTVANESGLRKIRYTIQAGDTLTKIAARFNVTKKEILEWNQVKDEGYIHPNQELIIMLPAKG
jgi:membrane-bound lytic murein transglycosylase D